MDKENKPNCEVQPRITKISKALGKKIVVPYSKTPKKSFSKRLNSPKKDMTCVYLKQLASKRIDKKQ